MKRIRIKKEIALVWAVTTNGHEEPLEGRNLSLFLVDPKYRKTAKTFHIENGNEVHFRVYPSEQPFTGVYTLELWENLGGQDQTVVDKRSAFELVNFTPQECDGSVDDIHAAEVFIGSGNLAVGIHGRGIVSVTKVSEDPNDWDYRILYDDGATEIIQIARGEKGLTDEEHAELIAETLAAKSAAQSANLAATLAASKAAEAAEAAQTANDAAEAANAAKEAADAATEAAQEATAAANAAKTAANNAATLANNAAANANTKAALAQAAADATNAAIAAASTATAAANAATAAANTAAEAANTAAATANSAASNASAKATLANDAAVAANAAKDAANTAASAANAAAALANDAAARAEAAILTIENKIERVELVCEDDQHITRKGSSVALTYEQVKALVDDPKNFVTLRYLDMFWMLPSYDDGGAIMFTSSGIEFGHVVVTRVILNTDGQMNNYSIIAEDADHKTDDMSKETAMDGHMTYPTTHAVNLKLDDLQSEITEFSTQPRAAVADDVYATNGGFTFSGKDVIATRAGVDPIRFFVFKENIKAIEFKVASLWDSNLISLAYGVGVTPIDAKVVAFNYFNTSVRPNEYGSLGNTVYEGTRDAQYTQNASIAGDGRFSGQYRRPQQKPVPVELGKKYRISLIDGFFKGESYNETTSEWERWFELDTKGAWTIADRYGWNDKKGIGFAVAFGAFTNRKIIEDLVVIAEEGTALGDMYNVTNGIKEQKKKWLAIGDSLTDNDNNNGLSYVGFAARSNNLQDINKGRSGWTIYKMWRDRAEVGWEDAVAALPDASVVSILMGTNDFDTKSFAIPQSDEIMDTWGNPHPRFGTTDKDAADAKDTHTTLGCLRLMIERILELNPSCRLFVFAPFYREKGSLIGSTGWNKDLFVNAEGRTIYDYADAIVSVAREYNIPTFNTARECGINPQTLEHYTYDDLHINDFGGALVGEYVGSRISQYLAGGSSANGGGGEVPQELIDQVEANKTDIASLQWKTKTVEISEATNKIVFDLDENATEIRFDVVIAYGQSAANYLWFGLSSDAYIRTTNHYAFQRPQVAANTVLFRIVGHAYKVGDAIASQAAYGTGTALSSIAMYSNSVWGCPIAYYTPSFAKVVIGFGEGSNIIGAGSKATIMYR